MSVLTLSARERVILEDALLLAQDKLLDLSKDLTYGKASRNGAIMKCSQVAELYNRVALLDPAKRTAFDVIGNDDVPYADVAFRSSN